MAFDAWNSGSLFRRSNKSVRRNKKSLGRKTRSTRKRLTAEILEDRRVLSANAGTATFDDTTGILTICGTDAANRIILAQDADSTNILLNADFLQGQQSFVRADVTMIVITGGGGDDMIFGESITLGMNINGDGGNDTIVGGSGDDTLMGGEGNDTISGRAGNDMITGNAGDDRLLGQDGDDEIMGGAGNDTLLGQDGADILNGNEGDDLMIGEAGNDTINGDAGDDTAIGGDGDDTISGGADGDRLIGDAGNDTITGGGGSDLVIGGDGDDITEGGDGDDIVIGGAGNDVILGQEGNDLLCGDAGEDELDGGLGDDILLAGDGNDILNGRAGDDILLGSGGDDTINGNEGDDLLRGGDGRDIVIGGTGADRLNGVSLGDIVIGGSSGIDNDAAMLASLLAGWTNTDNYTTRVAAASAILGDLPRTNDDGAVDILRGEDGDDYFVVHSAEDQILGQDGGEIIDGRALLAGNDEYSTPANTVLTVGLNRSLLLNDTDPNGEVITVNTTPFAEPTSGTVELNADGTFTYTPDADFVGQDLFVYEITNESNELTFGSVTINVEDVNPAPVAVDDSYTVDEDETLFAVVGTNDLLMNDSDPNNDTLTVTTTPVENVSNGILILNDDGSFTYAADDDFNGTDSFVYEISDGTSTATATVTITVNPVSDAPIARDDEYTVAPGATLTTTLGVDDILQNDSDADGDAITVNTIPIADPTSGTLVLNADGTFEYTPDDGFTGVDMFIYEIEDATGQRDQATVAINVTDQSSPVAADDEYTIDEDVELTTILGTNDLLLNDTDPDGDTLTVNTTPIANVDNGTLVLNADGTFTYTPNADFNGTDSFIYEISDGNESDQATVTINVTPAEDAPIAGDDAYEVDVNTTLTIAVGDNDLLGNDVEPDGEMLTVVTAPTMAPTNGTLTLNDDGSFEYIPDTDFVGTDSFEYQVEDTGGNTDTATVTINVREPNTAPTAMDDAYTVNEDGTLAAVLGTNDLLSNDSDPDGDTLTVNTVPVSDVSDGVLELMENGVFTYTPDPNFNGTDQFTYEVSDGRGGFAEAVVTITVESVEDDPIAGDDAYTVNAGETLTTVLGDNDLLQNDSDADGDTITVSTTPIDNVDNGTLVLNTDGTFTYTPQDGFTGTDQFTYEISDENGSLATAIATIDVVTPNSDPVARPDRYSIGEDGILQGVPGTNGLLDNDTDADGDTLMVNLTPTVEPENGLVVLESDGSFTYTPSLDYNGLDSFTYEVMDGNGGSSTATATINIAAINDDPIALRDTYTTDTDVTLTVSIADGVLSNDSDPESDNLTVSTTPSMNVSNGTLTLNADGSFEYTPNPGFEGDDMFIYMVMDEDGGMAAGIVDIEVQAPENAAVVDSVFAQPTDEDAESDSDTQLIDLVFGEAQSRSV